MNLWNSNQTAHTFLGLAHDAATANDIGGTGHEIGGTDHEDAETDHVVSETDLEDAETDLEVAETDLEVAEPGLSFGTDPHAERNPYRGFDAASSYFVLHPCGQILGHYHLACTCTERHDHARHPCSWKVGQNFVPPLFHCIVETSSEMSLDLFVGCLAERVYHGSLLIWSHAQPSQNFLPFLDKIEYHPCSVC
jgi:hypothetical protein